MIQPHTAPQEHSVAEGLLIQRLGRKHNPLAIKNLFVPFYYKQLQKCEISAEQRAFPKTTYVSS